MILTGSQIKKEVIDGNLGISDFDEKRLGPNSYNVRLDNKLLIYTGDVLDMKKDNPYREIIIPEEGYVLQPGEAYLGKTIEVISAGNFVPMIEGRSSIGRLFINIHATAGFCDIGFNGYITLEISVTKPIRIYAGVEIGQMYYTTIYGEPTIKYKGKYQDNNCIQTSRLYKDFE